MKIRLILLVVLLAPQRLSSMEKRKPLNADVARSICQLVAAIKYHPSVYELHDSSQERRSTNWNTISYTEEIPPEKQKIKLHYYWLAQYMSTTLAYTEYKLKDTYIVAPHNPFARYSQSEVDGAASRLRSGYYDDKFKEITKYPETETCIAGKLRNRESFTPNTQYDGPNITNDVILAGSKEIPQWPFKELVFHFTRINSAKKREVQTPDYSSALPRQELITLALGSSAFALVGKEYGKQVLSWYHYQSPSNPQLKAKAHLPGTLSKVAFVTPRILLGLTGDKRLITLWLDKSRIRFQAHKIPFPIQQFAIDPYTSDQLVFSYEQDGQFCIAATSLSAVAAGKCQFKKLHSTKASQCQHRLTYVHGYAACEFQGRSDGNGWMYLSPTGVRIVAESLPKKCLETELLFRKI